MTDDIQSRRMIARSSIPSRLKALGDHGIAYEQSRGGQYFVADRFVFYPAVGMWRDQQSQMHGYTVGALIDTIRKLIEPEKPVAGRDIADAPSKPTGQRTVDESAAGAVSVPIEFGARRVAGNLDSYISFESQPSENLLPKVSP